MKTTLAIYYATVTGNAEALAQRVYERALKQGWDVRLCNLADIALASLSTETRALFVVSTWGDGEPPADAADNYYALEKPSAPALHGLRYAVFGLGDRDYQDFNAFARKLDERLALLGAQRMLARVEADLDYEDSYVNWENCVLPLIGESASISVA